MDPLHERTIHRSGGGLLPILVGLVGLGLAGCSFHGRAGDADATPGADAIDDATDPSSDGDRAWLDGFAHRKLVTVVATPEDLAGFPTPITIADDPDLAGTADVAFTAEDGTSVLPMEFSDFGLATGSMTQWIRIDRLAGTPTKVWLYYDGGPRPHTSGRDVWMRYRGAWHMSNGADGSTPDSARGNTATAAGAAIPQDAEGILGRARRFDGIDDTLDAGDPGDGSLDVGTSSFGYSVWVNAVMPASSDYDTPLNKGGSNPQTAGYDFELGRASWNTSINDDSGDAQVEMSFGNEPALHDAWHFLAASIDRAPAVAKSSIFLDGARVRPAVDFTKGNLDNDRHFRIGRDVYFMKGLVDEVRVYDFAPTDAWFAAEFAAITAPATIRTIGPEQSR